MRKPSALVVISSLLSGAILTALFLAQMGWSQFTNCQNPYSNSSVNSCAIMEYGFPKRFVGSELNFGQQNIVFATTKVDKTNLILNWMFWSAISFAVLVVLANQYQPPQKPAKKPGSKR